MKAPSFWEAGQRSLVSTILTPFGWLYGLGTQLRVRFGRSRRIGVPVICVGNLIAGGTGKTPVVIAIASMMVERGINVHVVTRGYGGTTFGPHLVADNDPAEAVGDEAKLLARAAPTWVSDDRVKGCLTAIQEGAEVIIFDDGFQDPSVDKALSLIVVDGGYGFGNGRMIPAGPLRETVQAGLSRADGVIVIGKQTADLSLVHASGRTVVQARRGFGDAAKKHASGRIFAFAGIGRPINFFNNLQRAGLTLAGSRTFADHHPYTDDELAALREDAKAFDAVLMTTEKDFVRLTPAQQTGIVPIPMTLKWPDEGALDALIEPVVQRFKQDRD